MHVAGVYDGDSLKIYINGIRNAALYADVPMEIANDRIFIGKANRMRFLSLVGKWTNSDFGIMHVVLNKYCLI